MTRGGKRPGAGRPQLRGEKRATHLGGVRVTPTQLESYRRTAMAADMSLSEWVTLQLDMAVIKVANIVEYADKERKGNR